MSSATPARTALQEKIRTLHALPTLPMILRPLLEFLDEPVERVDMNQLAELISADESLAAQCLRMANSPLYSRFRDIETVRGAIIALGIARVREILLGCTLLHLLPRSKWVMDPVIFWEHSFGSALISRRFAARVDYASPDRAYLAGLLHDIGVIASCVAFPKEFEAAARLALEKKIPLQVAEAQCIGLDHCESGGELATQWRLPDAIAEVVCWHHDVQQARLDPALVALVSLSDQLCRLRGLGFGYTEARLVDFFKDPSWSVLAEKLPAARSLDLAKFTFEMDDYVKEVRTMVGGVFR